ncbi:GrpB family protein [Kribbella capetownensis]|nr:GrpB family protein [Kribbella capetownensis]
MDGILAGSGLGLTRGEVSLEPSDPAWQAAYGQVALKLRAALSDLAIAVEHVGSTAVPGLPAKPILDIAVGLRPAADRDTVFEALQSLGFIHRGTVEEDEGLTMMFGWEDTPRHRIVNLHVVTHDTRRWREWLSFRDQLRADQQARDAYADLKADLARKFPNDRKSYIAGKDTFVQRILTT